VKPAVRRYTPSLECVSEIMVIQQKVNAFREFLYQHAFLSPADRMTITGKLDNMLHHLNDDVTLLADVLTDNLLQMDDTERIYRIKGIHTSIMDKKEWLSRIVNQSHLLSNQRYRTHANLESLRQQNTVND